MSQQFASPPAARPLTDYSWRVLGVREFVISGVINGAIAYFVYRATARIPIIGWLSLLVVCGPMSFLLPLLTTFFGCMNGVIARSSGRAGRAWPAGTPWMVNALQAALLAACVVAPIALAAFLAAGFLLPGWTLSRAAAVLFVGLYGAGLGYLLHARAAILAGRWGAETGAVAASPSESHGS